VHFEFHSKIAKKRSVSIGNELKKTKLCQTGMKWSCFLGQVTEIQIRAAVLNGFKALGISKTVAVGLVRPVSGEVQHQPDLCNKAA
jgi:hypothetical protein